MNEAKDLVVAVEQEQRRLFWERVYVAAMQAAVANLPVGGVLTSTNRFDVASFAEGQARQALESFDRLEAQAEREQAAKPERAPKKYEEEDEENLYLGPVR